MLRFVVTIYADRFAVDVKDRFGDLATRAFFHELSQDFCFGFEPVCQVCSGGTSILKPDFMSSLANSFL